MKRKRHTGFARFLSVFLIAALCLPPPALALRPEQSPKVKAGLEESFQPKSARPEGMFSVGLREEPAETRFVVRPEMTKTELEKIALSAIRDLGEKIRRFGIFGESSPVELDVYKDEEIRLDNQELDIKKRRSDRGALDSSIGLAHAVHNSVDAVVARARHFGRPQQGTIQFRVRQAEKYNYLVLELSDNGIGIDPSTLEDLFAKEVTTKDPFSNRWIGGLGQAIASGYYGNFFLQRWGGRMMIETRYLSGKPELLRLRYIPFQAPLRDIRAGRRSEMGTTVRWIFPKEIFSSYLSDSRPAVKRQEVLQPVAAGLEEKTRSVPSRWKAEGIAKKAGQIRADLERQGGFPGAYLLEYVLNELLNDVNEHGYELNGRGFQPGYRTQVSYERHPKRIVVVIQDEAAKFQRERKGIEQPVPFTISGKPASPAGQDSSAAWEAVVEEHLAMSARKSPAGIGREGGVGLRSVVSAIDEGKLELTESFDPEVGNRYAFSFPLPDPGKTKAGEQPAPAAGSSAEIRTGLEEVEDLVKALKEGSAGDKVSASRKILNQWQEYQASAEEWLPAVAGNLKDPRWDVLSSNAALLTALAAHPFFHDSINQVVVPAAAGNLKDPRWAVLSSNAALLTALAVDHPAMLVRVGITFQELGFPEGVDADALDRFGPAWGSLQKEPGYPDLSLGARAALRRQLLLDARRYSQEDLVGLGQQRLNHLSRLEKLDQALGLPSMGAEIHLSPEEGTRAAPVAVNLAAGVGSHEMVPVHPEGADLLDIRLLPGTLSSFSMLFRQFLESSEVKRLRTVVGHYSVGVDLKGDVVMILLALFFGDPAHPWAPREARGDAIAGVPGSNTYLGQTLDIYEGNVTETMQTNLDVRPAMVDGEILAYDDLEAVAMLSMASTEPKMRVLFDRFLKQFDDWLQEVGGTDLRNAIHAARRHIAAHSGQMKGVGRDLDHASYLIFEKLHGISPDQHWKISAELKQISDRVSQARQDGGEPDPRDLEKGRALQEQFTQSNGNGSPQRERLKEILDETLNQIRAAVLVDPQVVGAVWNYRRAVIQGGSLEALDNRYQEAVKSIPKAILDHQRTFDEENRLLDLLQTLDPNLAAKVRSGLRRNEEKTPPAAGAEEQAQAGETITVPVADGIIEGILAHSPGIRELQASLEDSGIQVEQVSNPQESGRLLRDKLVELLIVAPEDAGDGDWRGGTLVPMVVLPADVAAGLTERELAALAAEARKQGGILRIREITRRQMEEGGSVLVLQMA